MIVVDMKEIRVSGMKRKRDEEKMVSEEER